MLTCRQGTGDKGSTSCLTPLAAYRSSFYRSIAIERDAS